MKAECLDFRDLPGQNPLFLDYLYDFDRVRDFYRPVHRSETELQGRAAAICRRGPRFPRRELAGELEAFNFQFGRGPALVENLQTLARPDSVAVLAGQQVGLFGGPAYTVYKAATAVLLARRLQEAGFRAVPVFWLASDDSDFEEVRTTRFYAGDGRQVTASYPDLRSRPEQMAGTVSLEKIEECLTQLESELPEGPFRGAGIERLRRHYQPSRDFRQAFGGWLAEVFADQGLILFDPLLPGIRSGLAEFYSVAVEKRASIVESLQRRKRELESLNYSAQVRTDESETLLFWVEGNNRFKLEFEDGRFRAKHRKGVSFERDELLEAIRRQPASFSPNALLRPVLQDHLFPTTVCVGGASEVAYFSQVDAISGFWELDMAVLPRAGFTLIDSKAHRWLSRYRLTASEILKDPFARVAERVIRQGDAGTVLEQLDELYRDVQRRVSLVRSDIAQQDPPVAEMLDRSARKIFYQINRVRGRFLRNQQGREGHRKHHLDHFQVFLKPEDTLQERIFNFNQFLIQEGDGFPGRLFEHLHPFCHSHQLVYL